MKQRILSILLCVLLILIPALPVSAAQTGSVTVLFKHNFQPVEQASFQIYKVAQWNKNTYDFVSPFSDYPVRMAEALDSDKGKALTSTLAAYAARDELPMLSTKQTDTNGRVCFDGLTEGIYLVVGETTQIDNLILIPQPMLLTVPFTKTDGTTDYDVVTEPKYDFRKLTEKTIERRVLKIWKDDGNEQDRPQEITVQLLCDGNVYEEQTLNEANNWRYTWKSLDAAHNWTLTEKKVPENYTVQVEQQGVTFTVTNTNNNNNNNPPPKSDTPSDSNLPQTGLLWWPVPVLIGAGAILLFCGIFLFLRKKNNKNE